MRKIVKLSGGPRLEDRGDRTLTLTIVAFLILTNHTSE
jgi:hypothetical protein